MGVVRRGAPRAGPVPLFQLARRGHFPTPRRILDRLIPALLDRPTDIVLDVSTRCNLRCAMCSLHAYGPGRDMDMATLRALTPALAGLHHVSLTCSGEPLLNPHLFEMIRHVKQHTRAAADLFTNGVLLTPEHARRLVRLGLDSLVVSLDAATPETYAAIRGGDFRRVLENVRGLAQAKREAGSERPAVAIGFVAMRRNVAELPAAISLAADLGAREIRVHGLEPYSEEMAAQMLYGAGTAGSGGVFEAAIATATRLGLRMILPDLTLGPRRHCRPAPHVAWDGTLRPCGELVYARPFYFLGERRQHGELSFGNVRDRDFRSLWHSPEYRHFRRRLRRGDFPQECDGCLMSYGVIC